MRQIIYVDRQQIDLGDMSDLSADELRAVAQVPDDRDLWQSADWSYRERLGGPMTMDEKITDQRVYLGPGGGRPARFFTAPKYINNSSNAECEKCGGSGWDGTIIHDEAGVCSACDGAGIVTERTDVAP